MYVPGSFLVTKESVAQFRIITVMNKQFMLLTHSHLGPLVSGVAKHEKKFPSIVCYIRSQICGL